MLCCKILRLQQASSNQYNAPAEGHHHWLQDWLEQDIELVVTTGGNGIGPRDITLSSLEPFFDYRLEGVEQTLHSIAQIHNQGFYVDRLAAGKIGKTIVICLPMDPDLAQDALNVFLPNIHQAFEF